MITFYALARTGLHQCNEWAKGPVSPVYYSTFRWPEDIAFNVYHDAGSVMLVGLTVPDDWYEQWLPFLDDAFPAIAMTDCIYRLTAAAASDRATLGATNARAFLSHVGFTSADYAAILADPQIAFWACTPGYDEIRFGSLKDGLRAGYRP